MKKRKLLLIVSLLFVSASLMSQTLTYRPISPFFGGNNPFAYQQILASANAQNDFQESNDGIEQQSDLENFTESLNRQLLNSLSNDLFQEQFGDQGLTEGTFVFGSLAVEVTPTNGGLLVNILNTETGEQTQIIIPGTNLLTINCMKKVLLLCTSVAFLVLSSCGAYFNQPYYQTKARIGESTSSFNNLIKEFQPKEKIIVGVYKFRDQTGQYKPAEAGSTFSTAVTQGGTSILLKSLEESKWFKPIERENIANLLNERQIIRSTRQEYEGNKSKKMPPLLFAGIILEGGVVSYDSNIITGGSGVRYFGIGASNQYREDRITVYLRAVSTSSGEILKNVYVSKTILSQGISANLYRFVNLRRLLEVETGVTKTEPGQLAVKSAIDKAVEQMIIEGVSEGLWAPKGGKTIVDLFKKQKDKEKKIADKTLLYNRKQEERRGRFAASGGMGLSRISGDYANSTYQFGFDFKLKYMFDDPKFNFWGTIGRFELDNKGIFNEAFITSGLNFEYVILPKDRLTPYIYTGIGSISRKNLSETFFKYQGGVGVEYLITNKIGIYASAEGNMLMSDNLDRQIVGEKNDLVWRFGGGVNIYF